MQEIVDITRDGVLIAAGGGVLWKVVSDVITKIKSGNKAVQTVNVNAGNGSNGKSYATTTDLSNHELKCAGAVHEKINSNYMSLTDQMHTNHKEVMSVMADMRVSITKLETRRGTQRD